MLNFEYSFTNSQLIGASSQWITSWIISKKKILFSTKKKWDTQPWKDTEEPETRITK